MGSISRTDEELPLLQDFETSCNLDSVETGGSENHKSFKKRVWIESKKLWVVAGPSIFSRIASYAMNIATQVFAGHLGDVELASISIANTVIVGFSFGLLVFILLL